MDISICDVKDLLREEHSLTNPSLEVLNPNHQPYRALLLQPAGPILADDTRIGPLDLIFADMQAMKFLELAKAKGHHLVVTPEYYLPIQTLLKCAQGDTFPAVGALWVLGCESMTPAQLRRFKDDCTEFCCDVIFEADAAAPLQGIYFSPVAYCFVTKGEDGNDRRVIILQFKTIPSRDERLFEHRNLRCGKRIYQFRGIRGPLALSTIICSDAFNVAADEDIRSKLADRATLLHIQLNPEPRNPDFLQYRINTFTKNKTLNSCDIVCLNWAENIIQHSAPIGQPKPWENETGSAWYICDDRCSSNDEEVENNERHGLYYSRHVNHRHVLHFHFSAAAFELTVGKVVQDGYHQHNNHLGPKLDARYTWAEEQQDWVPNPEYPDPGSQDLFSLTHDTEVAFAKLKTVGSQLQIERAIALSCGLKKRKLDWFNAGELDACQLGRDEILNRVTLCLDRNIPAKEMRERRMSTVAVLHNILNTQTLPPQIRDLAGGGAQVMWYANSPHTNVFKDGLHPALVSYLGVAPPPDTVSNVSDAAFERLRLENNDNHKHRIAVCYYTVDGKTAFPKIPQLTSIMRSDDSATSIAYADGVE